MQALEIGQLAEPFSLRGGGRVPADPVVQRLTWESPLSTEPNLAPQLLELDPSGSVDLDAADRSPAVGLHTSGRRLPLLLVHSWAREGAHLQQLARCLGSDQPIYGISPPSGEWPVDFPRTVEDWSGFCLAAIHRMRRHGPYVLGGWSFGGVIALSLAEHLVASGEDVRRVVMIDSRLPTKHLRKPRTFVRKCLHHLDEALGKERGQRLAYVRAETGNLWGRGRAHGLRWLGGGAAVARGVREPGNARDSPEPL